MVDGELLHDHPAHRRAHDVHGVEAEVIEQTGHVGGQVGQPVRRVDVVLVARERLRELRGEIDVRRLDLRREADVAVVESNDVEPAVDEGFAQAVVPRDGLAPEAHHQ